MDRIVNTPSPTEIKQARKDAGLTQTQAAALVGRKLRQWQYWESNNFDMPSPLWELFTIKIKQG